MNNKKLLLILIISWLLACYQTWGQTYRDSTITTRVCRDSTYVIRIPIVEDYVINSMYISPIEDWIANADSYLSWAKRQGVNELNLYARAYITNSSRHSTLAAFIKKAKEQYGIKKVFVDYRLTSEIPGWQSYVNKYKNTTSNVDGMITEREPYVTGDYAGFWPFLQQGKAFTKANNLLFAVYMGHPTQQGWDSICFYTDRVYLSLYITMSTWANSTNGYNFVNGRFNFMVNSNTKFGRKDMPVIYIISLEKLAWGASNEFMGDWFINNPFFGSTWDLLIKQYNNNASTAIKERTELGGSCIFYSKFARLAKPQ